MSLLDTRAVQALVNTCTTITVHKNQALPVPYQELLNLLQLYANALDRTVATAVGQPSPSTPPEHEGLLAGAGANISALLLRLPESLLRSSDLCTRAYAFIRAWINGVLQTFGARATLMEHYAEREDCPDLTPIPSSICTTLAACLDPASPLNKISGHDGQNVEDDATLEWRRTLTFGDWVDALHHHPDGTKNWREAQVVMEISQSTGSGGGEMLLELHFKGETNDANNVQRSRHDRGIAPHESKTKSGGSSGGGTEGKESDVPASFYPSVKAGMKVDAIDNGGRWYNATVLHCTNLDKDGTVRITYRIYHPSGLYTDEERKEKFFGYRVESDEDHRLDPKEIRPLGTKATNILDKLKAKDDYKPVQDDDDPTSMFDCFSNTGAATLVSGVVSGVGPVVVEGHAPLDRRGDSIETVETVETVDTVTARDATASPTTTTTTTTTTAATGEGRQYGVYRGMEYEGGRWYIGLLNHFGQCNGYALLYRLFDPSGTLKDYTLCHSWTGKRGRSKKMAATWAVQRYSI